MVININQTLLALGNRLIESGTMFGEIWGKITNDAQISRFGQFGTFGGVEVRGLLFSLLGNLYIQIFINLRIHIC